MCVKTGNVVVEYKCIENTKSDFIIYVIAGKGIFYSSTNNFKIMLTDKINGRSLYGGDGGRSYMKIIKYDQFIENCREL